MAFATKYKLKRVLGNIDSDLTDDPISQYISSKYYYLSDKETHQLTIYYRFLENPSGFIETSHLKWKDTKRNAVEVKPAYHVSDSCQALHKRFDNVILPEKIQTNDKLLSEARDIAKREGLYSFKEKSKEELQRFVVICMEEMNHNHKDLRVGIKDFKIVHNKKNSGSREYSNMTLQEVKKHLELLILKSNKYFNFNGNRQLVLPNRFFNSPFSFPKDLKYHNRLQVLEKYRNYLSLIANKEDVRNNYTDFCTDVEIIDIAKEILNTFNIPTITAIEAEILKQADSKEFQKTILEVLGFRPCKGCNRNSILTKEEKEYVDKYRIK